MRHPLYLAFGILAWSASGCGSGSVRETVEPTVSDSAGVQIVDNGSKGALGDLMVQETLRLGVMEGAGPEQFNRIVAVELDDAGRIYVGNAGSTSVRVFDQGGSFLTEFGQRGDGPSELRGLRGLFLAGDMVALSGASRLAKVVLFDTDGTFVDSWTAPKPDGSYVAPIHKAPDGWLASVGDSRAPELATGEAWQRMRTIHRWDPESGSAGALVYEVPGRLEYKLGPGNGMDGGYATSLVPELSSHDFDRSGRLYVTDQHVYRIDLFEPSGLVRSVRREVALRPLFRSDADHIVQAALHTLDTAAAGAQLRASGRAPEFRRQMVVRFERNASLPLPDFVPPLGSLLVSPDGSFWVERADLHPIEESFLTSISGSIVPRDETVWDIFDVDGAFIGSATLPARFRAESVDGLTVVGVWADEFDVQYVIRYELSTVE